MGDSGQLGNQEEPHNLNRKGLLSQGSKSIAMKSRVNREVQARFCERLEVRPLRPTRPDFSSMNETDVREMIVRPLIESLGYRYGTEANIRTEQTLRYGMAFLGRKNPKRDPDLVGRADYIC